MECLKSSLDIFLKRSIQISVINSHTIIYKPIVQADSPAHLEFNWSGHSDYYVDLNSVRLLLWIKLVPNDGSDVASAEQITCCIPCLVLSLSH